MIRVSPVTQLRIAGQLMGAPFQAAKKVVQDEKERIKNVFRYLDPSGEGGVSLEEFQVLELLWSEVQLCIREFVQFLDRTIGDDLDEVWDFFDEDGGGEIDMEEWKDACANLGYFGPVGPIFRFLMQMEKVLFLLMSL